MATLEQVPDTGGNRREGNRWIGNPPPAAEVAEWFVENVRMPHPGLKHADYLPGIVLIPQTEKVRHVNELGTPYELVRLVHTPYVKVETRVAFFWDLCAKRGWAGQIYEVPTEAATDLPPGFFRFQAPRVAEDGNVRVVNFVGCSRRVVVEKIVKGVVSTVRRPGPGTKSVAVLDRNGYVDVNAIEKAETGAVGRALGMAGFLVLPGSGVITAEDMQEMLAAGTAASVPEEPTLPEEPKAPVDPRQRIAELIAVLRERAPEKCEEVNVWANEREIKIDDIKEPQLRAVLAMLEKKVGELDG